MKNLKLMKKLNILRQFVKIIWMILYGLKSPRVAVQALNPHAEFGTEEQEQIIPIIAGTQVFFLFSGIFIKTKI